MGCHEQQFTSHPIDDRPLPTEEMLCRVSLGFPWLRVGIGRSVQSSGTQPAVQVPRARVTKKKKLQTCWISAVCLCRVRTISASGGVASVHFTYLAAGCITKLNGTTAPEREVGCPSGTETGHVGI